MKIVDHKVMHAPAAVCFQVAADVERWPALLPHYRWVRFIRKDDLGGGLVDMAAWRPFPAGFKYPTRWTSEVRVNPAEPAVYHEHVRGISRGMAVKWEFRARSATVTDVSVTHEWNGPQWPLIGRIAASWVILPHFVSDIAQRTLAGVAAEAERLYLQQGHAKATQPISS